MNLLTEQELSKLSTKTSRDLAQRWQGMERKLSGKDGVTIANTGLVNSGKSSLFNALLDRNDGTERFPVGPDHKAWRSGASAGLAGHPGYAGN